MKKMYYPLLFVLFYACNRPISVEVFNENIEPVEGKCYFSKSTQKTKGGFILKVIDNQFVIRKDSVKVKDLVIPPDGIVRIEYLENALRPKLHHTISENCITWDKSAGQFQICYIEMPSEYLGVTQNKVDSLLSKGIDYLYFDRKILEEKAMIQKINYRRKPNQLEKGQIWLKNGNWEDVKELICYDCMLKGYTIRLVEASLKFKGYETNEDNVLSRKEKKELHRFQKDNGLKVGGLTPETLKKLGLNY